jgi:hypothetical protein
MQYCFSKKAGADHPMLCIIDNTTVISLSVIV